MFLFMALGGLYDQFMVNLKRYWTGPSEDLAWQFSGLQRGMYIRTWPVKFRNRESFEAFFRGIADNSSVQSAREAWALYVLDNPVEKIPQQLAHCAVTSPHFVNREFESTDEFLRGMDPRAMRAVNFSARVQWPGAQKGFWLLLRNSQENGFDRRGARNFVSFAWHGGVPEDDDFPSFLPPVLSLLEQHTVPMTLWDRIAKRPVVSRFSVSEIDEKRGTSRTLWWSAGISFVTAALTAWLTSVLM